MRRLIEYFKQLFCNHNLEFEEEEYKNTHDGKVIETNTVVSQTCKKCGFHKSYKKYDI